MPTVFLNERRRRKLPVGSRGMHPGEMCLDFYTLRSPFLGFSVIQSGYWPDFNSESFFLEKFIHLWKLWPIFVKRCRPVWIHACNINVSPSLGSRTWDPVKNNCFSFGFLQKKWSFYRALFFVMSNSFIISNWMLSWQVITYHQEYLRAAWSFLVQYYSVERQIFIIHKFDTRFKKRKLNSSYIISQ